MSHTWWLIITKSCFVNNRKCFYLYHEYRTSGSSELVWSESRDLPKSDPTWPLVTSVWSSLFRHNDFTCFLLSPLGKILGLLFSSDTCDDSFKSCYDSSVMWWIINATCTVLWRHHDSYSTECTYFFFSDQLALYHTQKRNNDSFMTPQWWIILW